MIGKREGTRTRKVAGNPGHLDDVVQKIHELFMIVFGRVGQADFSTSRAGCMEAVVVAVFPVFDE
jgi:hypothetical protein